MAVRAVLRLGDPRLRQRAQPVDRCVEGFHALVVRHECDHLDGVLFPDAGRHPARPALASAE